MVATLTACLTIAVNSPAKGADGTELIGGERTKTVYNGAGDTVSSGFLFSNLEITRYDVTRVTNSGTITVTADSVSQYAAGIFGDFTGCEVMGKQSHCLKNKNLRQ